MTARRAAFATGALLLLVYLLTLAPGVTFWDAGEFIAAAHGLGIPHPPGTPLYVALGRAWIVVLGGAVGSARAMNMLSAVCTAAACAALTSTMARETRDAPSTGWGALAGGLLAGAMLSVWSNATETEVYAVSLLHVALLLACASRAADETHGAKYLALTAYLLALAPAVHLSALVAAPAAVALAARTVRGDWSRSRLLLLGGVSLATAGVGRASIPLVVAGTVAQVLGILASRRAPVHSTRALPVCLLLAGPLAASALGILLVRSRLDPPLNQGAPSTLAALADVVGRRQYPVAGLLPRQAPVWIQGANVLQYLDWQVAMGWGHGIVTSPGRVLATVAYVCLAAVGWWQLRRCAPRLAFALLVLLACGTAGVAAYLNMKAGASLGWGVIADSLPHEARERDYFFVPGFVAVAALAGWGAAALAARAARPYAVLVAVGLPLVANWPVVDRSRGDDAGAARAFGAALLGAAPPYGVLFTGGDNDSYPLWYLQQVERLRTDVLVVTVPLLPAEWYAREIGRRTGWRWDARVPAAGALWAHDLTAAGIARAAAAAGRTVSASPALTARERGLLGSGWVLRGPVYVATRARQDVLLPTVDLPAARAWIAVHPRLRHPAVDAADDVAATMLALLDCPRLGLPWPGGRPARDSLEVRCNFR